MSVLEDILEWSVERPAWQRDALRRIVTQIEVTEQDLAELRRLCLVERGITFDSSSGLTAIPLSAEHLTPAGETGDRVQLIGLRDVQGVNALAPGQQMGFEPNGMTVVFGYNGSGKSGYARILRQLCHARHRGDRILPNAFTEDDHSNPSATIDYRVGTADCSEIWQQGQESPVDLMRVSFFDAECAAVHVGDANELAFTPFGLYVLPKLVNICRHVSDSIAQLMNEQEGERPASLVNPQEAAEGTPVRILIDAIDVDSNVEDYRRESRLSDKDLQKIVELREALGTNPATRARELRNTVMRLRRLTEGIQTVASKLSSEAVIEIQNQFQDLIAKKDAARIAAEQAFGDQPLSGVGEDVWQRLWEAAREYSRQQAYPDRDFPFSEDDARCVLCQQPLAEDAQERMRAFETFVRKDTQQAADLAADALRESLTGIRELTVGLSAYRHYVPDLPESQLELKKAVGRFYRIAWKTQRVILRACEENAWSDPYPLPASPTHELEALMREISEKSEQLERAAGAEERQKLRSEQNELMARQWLASILDDVEKEISRKKTLAALKAAAGDTVTTGITRKNTELTDRYVTDVLRKKLTDEIGGLGADYLRVELDSPGGRLGQKRFKISLHGAPEGTRVRDVLSEGEFRCIALAGFLAELSTEQTASGLVFDDPVCSLDHQWRRKVAARLVREAANRQVIVFTHDIVFLTDLVGFCEARDILLKQTYLRRGVSLPGECMDGVPWAAMKVKNRIGKLKNLFQAAESICGRQGRDAYEPEARRIYGLLRETWERAVEEVLLNGVVIRFDRAIHTMQLGKISDITPSDIQVIEEGMTKSSRFLEGHDEAGAVTDPVPGPDELRQDIGSLDDWVKSVRQRR